MRQLNAKEPYQTLQTTKDNDKRTRFRFQTDLIVRQAANYPAKLGDVVFHDLFFRSSRVLQGELKERSTAEIMSLP